MTVEIDLNKTYVPSEDVVARDVQGELILIPISAVGSNEEEVIFSANETGRAVWDQLAQKKSLKAVVEELSKEFSAPPDTIKQDVRSFLKELLKRKIVHVLR
ncbi:MAG: PqqD family protein [Candidatus Omnitrophica bacterium]|nr:PqqD family protein [Candidatus Omnitrophota bacterium]